METVQKKTLLPFASYSNNESGVLKPETERSAVFCLSELNRDKGGGLFRKKQAEKTVFVTKVYYPFWIGSFKEQRLLFDGLNISSHSIMYPAIPDVKAFIKSLRECSLTGRIYSDFLSNQLGYFQQSNGEKVLNIDGFISDQEFAEEFTEYLKEASLQTQVTDGVLISPACDSKQLEKCIKTIDDSNIEFIDEHSSLSEIIKLLNTKTQAYIDVLRNEIAAIDKKYSGPIKEAKQAFEKKKKALNKEYSDKVNKVSSKLEQQSIALNKEIIRLEKTISDLNAEIEQTDVEVKNALICKDEQTEQRLKEKKSELKKKLPECTPKIKSIKEQIQNIEDDKRDQLFKLRQANEAKIKEASKDLLEVEAVRDAEKKVCQDEMEKIEEHTSKITTDLDKLSKTIEVTLGAFDKLGLKGEKIPPQLIHMPFYLLCYMSQKDKRFVYVAPSIVNMMDMGVRLKSLGRKRLTQLFEPRSEKIVSILNKLLQLLSEDVAFRHEITQACSNANMLKCKQDLELIRTGLNGLKEDGWISNEEYDDFSQTLTQL